MSRTRSGTAPLIRWPLAGAPQRGLLLAGLLASVGSVLPWLWTPAGALPGTAGPGLWTLCAATIALAGGLLTRSRVAGAHAVLAAVVLLALPLWQIVRMLSLVGYRGWMPGVGMILVLAGGVLVARAAPPLLRTVHRTD